MQRVAGWSGVRIGTVSLSGLFVRLSELMRGLRGLRGLLPVRSR